MTDRVAIPVTMSREYAELLVSLSAAFQRAQMYPGGHPMLDRAIDQALVRLEPILVDRPSAVFAVGPAQLFVGGAATDDQFPPMRELAARLFRRNVGTVKLSRGIERAELATLFQALTPERTDFPRLATAHVEVEPLNFDGLALDPSEVGIVDDEVAARANEVWFRLAAVMFGIADGGPRLEPGVGGPALARAFEGLPQTGDRDEAVIASFHALAEAGADRTSASSVMLRRQVTGLLRSLQPETLERLLGTASGSGGGLRLVADLIQLAASSAAVEVILTAARVNHLPLSAALRDLLAKLARQAETAPRASRHLAADQLYGALRAVLAGWMAEPSAEASRSPEGSGRTSSDPFSVLTMHLDMGFIDDRALAATRTLLDSGRVARIAGLLDQITAGDPVARSADPLLATPELLAALLAARPVDIEAVERLAPRVGKAGIPALLDGLAHASERNLRRRLIELLVRFGNDLAPGILARLPGAPWYLQRNLLRLLQRLPEPPPESVAREYAGHTDPRVRLEARRLLLRYPAERARSIVQGLGDTDPSGVRFALMAAVEDCPPAATPLLLSGLLEGRIDPGMRPAAIRALGGMTTEPAVLDLLLRIASRRVPLLGLRLAAKSRESLAALSALSRHWRWDPRTAALIIRAERHRDPEIRNAVSMDAALAHLGLEPPAP